MFTVRVCWLDPVPDTATFRVVAPTLVLVMFPVFNPELCGDNLTKIVVGETAPLDGVNVTDGPNPDPDVVDT